MRRWAFRGFLEMRLRWNWSLFTLFALIEVPGEYR
jgi:hypothetical protein